MFVDAPAALQHEIDELHGQVRAWLARDGGGDRGWDVPATIDEAKSMLRERFSRLVAFIDIVAPPGVEDAVLAVPDTSVLIDRADVSHYPDALGVSTVALYLVPAMRLCDGRTGVNVEPVAVVICT